MVKFKYGIFIITVKRKRNLNEILNCIIRLLANKRGEVGRNETGIPKHELEAFVKNVLLPEMIAFFDSEEGKREFEEWKTNQIREKTA